MDRMRAVINQNPKAPLVEAAAAQTRDSRAGGGKANAKLAEVVAP